MKSITALWQPNIVVRNKDVDDWKLLNNVERHFVAHVLAFFAAFNDDGIVNENLIERFCALVKVPEARRFYDVQQIIVNVHSEMYSRLIEKLMVDQNQQ